MIHPATWLNEKLGGWPDEWLTLLLVLIAVFLVFVAWKSSPLTKAVIATWVLLP